MLNGHLLKIQPTSNSNATHPLGPLFNHLSTCLNSDELSVLAHLPVQEMPGLPMRKYAKFALSTPAIPGAAIRIGDLYNGIEHRLSELNISLRSLNLHALITGMPGFGKTTTCMQILTEAHRQYQVPFLVIEPAKKEYRQLAQLRPCVMNCGSIPSAQMHQLLCGSIHLNSCRYFPQPAYRSAKGCLQCILPHVWPACPYVLEEALLAVYQDRGWNIYTSKNIYLPHDDPEERHFLIPTLSDLLNKIEHVLKEKKYGQEVHQNMGAALRSRIKSLTILTKGQVLNSQRSSSLKDMMEHPTVIELQDLGDDQEKAFVMALLLVNIYEYAELRQQAPVTYGKDGLQHLTLVEEAHRLLSAGSRAGSEETGDPRGKAGGSNVY